MRLALPAATPGLRGYMSKTTMALFIRSNAGIFVVSAKGSLGTTLAEVICAGIIKKIESQPEKILDFGWWTECVSKIPGQVPVEVGLTKSNINITNDDAPTEIARLCASSKLPVGSDTSLEKAIAKYLSTIPGLANLLCFQISTSGTDELSLTLQSMTIQASPVSLDSTVSVTVDKTVLPLNDSNRKGLTEIFQGFRLNVSDSYVFLSE